MKKVLSLVLAVCLMGSILIGCTSEEKELWDAYLKTAEASSFAMDMTIKLSADSSNLTDAQAIEALKSINGMEIKITGNAISDTENGIIKADMSANTNVMGQDVNYKFWIDMDMSDSASPKFTAIYEFPKDLMPMLNKQYYVLDMSEMMTQTGMNSDFVKALNKKEILKSLEQIDTTGMKVEKKDGLFTVSFSSETFSSLMKQYFDIVLALPVFSALYPEGQKEILDSALKNFFESNIFGDKDITTTFTLNSDGFIEDMNNTFEFAIDPAKIGEAFGISDTKPSEKFTIGFELDCKYTNYNSITEIKFPELTAENSQSLTDMMNVPVVGDDAISVFVNGQYIMFDVPPQSVNDRTMVPMRKIFESLGATVNYDEETDTITSTAGDKVITHKIGENVIYINGEANEMDVESFVTEGRTLVPARFVAQAFGANVDWNEEMKSVLITLE